MNTFIAFVLSKVNKEKRRRRPSRWQRRSQRVRFFSFRKVIKRFYYIQCMYLPTTTTSRTRCRSPGGLKRDYAKERGKFNNNQHPMVLAFIINLYYRYVYLGLHEVCTDWSRVLAPCRVASSSFAEKDGSGGCIELSPSVANRAADSLIPSTNNERHNSTITTGRLANVHIPALREEYRVVDALRRAS